MSADYTILEAQIKRELPPTAQRPNPLVIWSIKVQDPQGNVIACEKGKRPENQLVPGQTLYGYIEERDGYPPNFKETQRANGGGGAQAQFPAQAAIPGFAAPSPPPPTVQQQPVQKEKDYKRSPDHPITVARMKHTSAMGSAPAYYTLFREESILPKPESFEHMKAQLLGLIEWLESTYPADPREQEDPVSF